MTILDVYLIIPKTPNPTTQTGILSFPRIARAYPNVQGRDNKSTPHNDWAPNILKSGAAWCIWGVKAKINYLVLDIKLLLININYVKNFLFLEIL